MLKKKLFDATKNQEDHNSGAVQQKIGILDLSLQNCAPADVSKYFPNIQHEIPTQEDPFLAEKLIQIQYSLNQDLSKIHFLKPPIEYVYNPTEYARIPNELFIRKFGQTKRTILFVGMNPGPYGMCQTGVPFGDTNWVKNWLQIEGPVSKPPIECPNRPVMGFNCSQKEQSGDRFWKFWSDLCGSPENFFRNNFVYNYCPLAFMNAVGKNLTPVDIKDCKQLESICDKFYSEVLKLYKPDILIAIGKYIEKRSMAVLKIDPMPVKLLCMPHPSPRSVNNHNWPEKAKLFLETNDLLQFF